METRTNSIPLVYDVPTKRQAAIELVKKWAGLHHQVKVLDVP